MKFPGIERLSQLRRALLPTAAEREADHQARLAEIADSVEAEIEERRRAIKAAADELRNGCVLRLRPFIGRLVLVSNFMGIEPEAEQVRNAVISKAVFSTETPIGISAVLSDGRSNHEALVDSANALLASFASSMGRLAFLVRPQQESSDLWLLALARAAEDTAKQANLPPHELGCFAVVSALDMYRQADTHQIPAPATAFRLTDISNDNRFIWELVRASVDS